MARMSRNRTYRVVDGERIEGVFRPVFVRNGRDYHLTELQVFTDGAIYDGEWGDLDGLRAKLEAGRVATTLDEGARASAFQLASWRFGEVVSWITPEELLGEVVDAIDRLNGRPDATDRCITAMLRYLDSRTETDRIALRAAYEAIPAHHRIFVLGDMDARDIPLRLLMSEVGETGDEYVLFEFEDGSEALGDDGVVTEAGRRGAFQYFANWRRPDPVAAAKREADGPAEARSPTVELTYGRPMYPRAHGLRNEFPAPIRVADAVYPTVGHAYWALSTDDEGARERIRTAPSTWAARDITVEAERRPQWPDVRLAVMADLLRAKFAQHPDLAEVLLATGDGRIHYRFADSPFWDTHDFTGRNWMGRLLELVRAELMAARVGLRL